MHYIAEILPYATAVALSPIPIVALILMLLSKRAKINSIAFSVGWIAGLAALVFIVSFLIGASGSAAGGTTGFSLKTLIYLILGIALLYLAFAEWKERRKQGQETTMPKWMSAIESFSPVKAFVIGFLLAMINTKNTPMGVAVGSIMAEAGGAEGAVLVTYLILGSLTMTIPTIAFLLFGNKLEGGLESVKAWLVNNNATIMFVLFLILGVLILSKGLGSL